LQKQGQTTQFWARLNFDREVLSRPQRRGFLMNSSVKISQCMYSLSRT
jgi:hypothetical protein